MSSEKAFIERLELVWSHDQQVNKGNQCTCRKVVSNSAVDNKRQSLPWNSVPLPVSMVDGLRAPVTKVWHTLQALKSDTPDPKP